MVDRWIEIERLEPVEGLSRRVVERAAWRAIVRRRLGAEVEVSYNRNGAPVLSRAGGESPSESPNVHPGYISVSHTKGWVAVIWSPEPCAIDIEPRDRHISPAAAKRYSLASIEDWCALEVRYKFTGLTDLTPPTDGVCFLPHDELVVAVIG